jgi:dTDP-4-amino-4,6-dideoxygalactose transaminase
MLEALHPGCAAVLLTTSCSHALELSALVLDLQPGDEVVLPSFTFVSTANAFALRGVRLRFADIDPATLCLDPASVAELVTDRTRAIVPVHYAGVGADMDALGKIAADVGAAVVEDNAHGLFGSLRGTPLGTFGSLSTLSFHETKNISAGEGGALVVNDPSLVPSAEIAREKGTNRSQFFRGMVDKYTWVSLGSSWLPSEFTAAAVVAGLEAATTSQRRRLTVWNRYARELRAWADEQAVRLPVVPDDRVHPGHLFHLLLPELDGRTRFIDHMKARGVHVVFHYVPLHTAPAAADHADRSECPVTDDVSERLVRLPLYADLGDDDLETVIAAALEFRC